MGRIFGKKGNGCRFMWREVWSLGWRYGEQGILGVKKTRRIAEVFFVEWRLCIGNSYFKYKHMHSTVEWYRLIWNGSYKNDRLGFYKIYMHDVKSLRWIGRGILDLSKL